VGCHAPLGIWEILAKVITSYATAQPHSLSRSTPKGVDQQYTSNESAILTVAGTTLKKRVSTVTETWGFLNHQNRTDAKTISGRASTLLDLSVKRRCPF
jgi:hypothetical protein